MTPKKFEAISLLPEDYTNEQESTNSYISFSFYEHREAVQRYINKNKKNTDKKETPPKINFISEIRFPLVSNSQLFRFMVAIPSNAQSLDFAKNLVYNSIQEYGGDIDSVISTLKETSDTVDLKNSPSTYLGSVNPTYKNVEDPFPTEDELRQTVEVTNEAFELSIGKATAGILDGSSDLLKGAKFSTGVAYNPNTRMLYDFSNPERRVFYYNFELMAKSQKEIENIRKAEYEFFKNSLPSRWTGKGEGELFGKFDGVSAKYINHFKFPKKIQTKVFIEGKEFKKFKFLDGVVGQVESKPSGEFSDSDHTFIKNENNKIFAQKFVFSFIVREDKVFTRNDIELREGKVSEQDVFQYESKSML